MVKSDAQKARARDTGSKLKFFERVAKEEKKEDARVRSAEVKDEEDDDQVECREARVSTGRNERAERGGHKGRKTPSGFVNQKISRHASGLITRGGERAGVKGLVGGPPVVNCVAGASAFCTPD